MLRRVLVGRWFGREGAHILICGRKAVALQAVTTELKQTGIDVLSLTADVSVEAEVNWLIEQTIAHYGRLDSLINNAGVSRRSLLIDTDPSVIQKVMAINCIGAVYATRYALPYLVESKGPIVGISSIAGHQGLFTHSEFYQSIIK